MLCSFELKDVFISVTTLLTIADGHIHMVPHTTLLLKEMGSCIMSYSYHRVRESIYKFLKTLTHELHKHSFSYIYFKGTVLSTNELLDF